jgi:tetrahydromethanopterin S-methyltransferase subunit G
MDFLYGVVAGMYLTILVIAVQLRLRKDHGP